MEQLPVFTFRPSRSTVLCELRGCLFSVDYDHTNYLISGKDLIKKWGKIPVVSVVRDDSEINLDIKGIHRNIQDTDKVKVLKKGEEGYITGETFRVLLDEV